MERSNRFEKFRYLFDRFARRKCADEERTEFLEMVASEEYSSILKDLINARVENPPAELEMSEASATRIFNRIVELANENEVVDLKPPKNIFHYWKSVAAAVLLLLAGTAYWVFKPNNTGLTPKLSYSSQPLKNDVAPGKTGAILTLSNGQKIVLDSANNGLLAAQGQTHIIKKNGEIHYSSDGNPEDKVLYNTMTTPKGRKYQLVLTDGSKVWLNAASSITYPTAFVEKERRVVVTGEAFFDISTVQMITPDGKEKMPFIVDIVNAQGGRENIKVLGTQFNVAAYAEEGDVKTTLVEGSVQVMSNDQSAIIKPGEVAVAQPGLNKIKVAKADVEEAIAWKEGFFNFRNADIETIMRQVARWYDVEIVYSNDIPKGHYRGEVSRDVNASEMLKVLELSGIRFNIVGKQIIVL